MNRLLFLLSALLALHGGACPPASRGLEYQTSAYWAHAGGVEIVGQYAYCAYQNGLIILDVSKPGAPVETGRVYCAGEGWDVDVWGDHAFLADGEPPRDYRRLHFMRGWGHG